MTEQDIKKIVEDYIAAEITRDNLDWIGDPDAVRGLPEGVAVREITPRGLAPEKALEAETAKANLASAVREFFLREAGPDQAPTNAP